MQATKIQPADLAEAMRGVMIASRRKSATSAHDSSVVALLAHLMTLEPLRAGELAERACLDPSTVSRHLRGLEEEGLLVRRPDPDDGRATLLRVTPDGRRLVKQARDQWLSVLRKAVADWSPEDLTTLTALVRRLGEDLEAV